MPDILLSVNLTHIIVHSIVSSPAAVRALLAHVILTIKSSCVAQCIWRKKCGIVAQVQNPYTGLWDVVGKELGSSYSLRYDHSG